MKYEALVDIGEYKKGDKVPTAKAEKWMKMFKVSPVKDVSKEEEVEPEPEEEPKKKDNFKEELMKIKGIGSKTAKDIISEYPSKEELFKDINTNKHLPFRDDIAAKLIRKYS